MRRGTCVRLFSIMVFSLVGSLVTAKPGLCLQNWQNIIIGKAFKFQSGILKEERALLFYLPEDYNTSSVRYPVLYLLDGDAHFHHVTGIVQFLAEQKVIPPMIVVALANTDRTRDFTPFKIERRPTSGGADRFLEFLRREVIPLVDAQYRTQPFRVLTGHSLGGLFAVYSLLQAPDLFQAYIAVSPAIGYGNGSIQSMLEAFLAERESLKRYLYISVGNEPRYIPRLEAFCDTLTESAPMDFRWEYTSMEEEDHASVTHRSIYAGLERLYSDWRLSQDLIDRGLESLEKHFDGLSEWFGYSIPIPARVYNLFGYNLIEEQKIPEAIEIFDRCIGIHPEYWYAYSNLGYCYMLQGKRELAIKNLERALELNPEDTQAARRLKQLK